MVGFYFRATERNGEMALTANERKQRYRSKYASEEWAEQREKRARKNPLPRTAMPSSYRFVQARRTERDIGGTLYRLRCFSLVLGRL